MIAPTDACALFGMAVALCAGAMCLYSFVLPPWFQGLAPGWIKALTMVLFISLLVPIPGTGIPFAGYFRGFIGDLSISLLALSIWSLCHRLFDVTAIRKRELTALLAVICVAALLLYPTALGWSDWDAYRLGWGSWWFISVLLAISAASALIGLRVLPVLIALALLAWSAGLMESGNLWDYLLDPWLSAFALGFVLIRYLPTLFKRFVKRSSH